MAHNFGLLCDNNGLLCCIVAHYVGLLGFPGKALGVEVP